MNIKRRDTGITLLEILLVLAIAMSVFIMSFRLYYGFRRDADVLTLRGNIDTLFQAAASYYQANCPRGGALDPVIATDPIKPINITADLINSGFLEATFPMTNPLVDATGPGNGYVVQFNKYMLPRMQQVCSNPPTCTLFSSTQIGTVVLWKIQVAVLMKNTSPTQLQNNKNYLLADCLSTASGSPATTALCNTKPTGNYLVFERQPSYATSDWVSQSTYWTTNPEIKQFQQLYTTNPITDLTNQDHTTEYQYYYCSG